MEQVKYAIRTMIDASDEELDGMLAQCHTASFKRKESVAEPGAVCNEVYFILSGMLRVVIVDAEGKAHTTHFALENEFICDYGSYLQNTPSVQRLEALEPLEVIVMPRKAIDWGYANLAQGDLLGRAIAEHYFVYLDNRIHNRYTRSPKERYDSIGEQFPNIHNRVPQHMIASYLGITPIHLSRLKKTALTKS